MPYHTMHTWYIAANKNKSKHIFSRAPKVRERRMEGNHFLAAGPCLIEVGLTKRFPKHQFNSIICIPGMRYDSPKRSTSFAWYVFVSTPGTGSRVGVISLKNWLMKPVAC